MKKTMLDAAGELTRLPLRFGTSSVRSGWRFSDGGRQLLGRQSAPVWIAAK